MLARSLYFSTVRRPVTRPAGAEAPRAPADPWRSRPMPSPYVLEIALWLHRSPGQESCERPRPPHDDMVPSVPHAPTGPTHSEVASLPRASRRVLCDSVRLRTVRAA